MSRLLLGLVCMTAMVGCTSSSVTQVVEDKPPFDVPKDLTPKTQDGKRPTSPEELRTQFATKIKQGLYTPFIELGYWQGATDQDKIAYLQALKYTYSQDNLTHRAKPMKDEDISIAEKTDPKDTAFYPVLPEDGSKVHQPTVTHILSVKAYFSDSHYVNAKYGVGSKDGRFYLSTLRSK